MKTQNPPRQEIRYILQSREDSSEEEEGEGEGSCTIVVLVIVAFTTGEGEIDLGSVSRRDMMISRKQKKMNEHARQKIAREEKGKIARVRQNQVFFITRLSNNVVIAHALVTSGALLLYYVSLLFARNQHVNVVQCIVLLEKLVKLCYNLVI